MKKNLTNNCFCLITGGTSGIGASFAFKLSELGYNLLIVGNNKSKLIKTSNNIKNKFNNKVFAIQCDLSKENSHKKIISIIKSKKLKIKFFIQSAGMGYYGKFTKSELSNNLKIIEINIKSIVSLSYFLVKHMMAHNDESYIVNIGSLSGFCPSPEMTVYSCSKNFIEKFSECLNYELRKTNIQVSYIAPGQTKTGFLKNFGKKTDHKNSMTSDNVVKIALKNILNKKTKIITGHTNYIRYLLFKIIPNKIILEYFYYKSIRNKQ